MGPCVNRSDRGDGGRDLDKPGRDKPGKPGKPPKPPKPPSVTL
jgi:hypothetical protein